VKVEGSIGSIGRVFGIICVVEGWNCVDCGWLWMVVDGGLIIDCVYYRRLYVCTIHTIVVWLWAGMMRVYMEGYLRVGMKGTWKGRRGTL